MWPFKAPITSRRRCCILRLSPGCIFDWYRSRRCCILRLSPGCIFDWYRSRRCCILRLSPGCIFDWYRSRRCCILRLSPGCIFQANSVMSFPATMPSGNLIVSILTITFPERISLTRDGMSSPRPRRKSAEVKFPTRDADFAWPLNPC